MILFKSNNFLWVVQHIFDGNTASKLAGIIVANNVADTNSLKTYALVFDFETLSLQNIDTKVVFVVEDVLLGLRLYVCMCKVANVCRNAQISIKEVNGLVDFCWRR